MGTSELEELGPVDFAVVEFPAGQAHFSGEVAAELARLSEAELIHVLDLLILEKNENGDVEALELEELDQVDELRMIETQLAEVLAEEDIAHLAAAMEPGSVAGVVIWENSWAAPFASSVRRSGGQLIANGRIPMQAIVAALQAEQAQTKEGV